MCATSAPRLSPLRSLVQVDAAAWQALFVALRSGCDTRSDPYFLGSLGVRIFDVRCAVTEAVMRNFAKLQFIDPKNRFGPGMSYLVFMLLPFVVLTVVSIPTFALEAILFILMGLLCLRSPLSAAPLPCAGAEARTAAHVAARVAVLDGFAKAHDLVISYECVRYTTLGNKSGNSNRKQYNWVAGRAPALRVRKATAAGLPAGLLQGEAAMSNL